jgi:hypothetical protein
MGRPRSVDPDGRTRWLNVLVAADTYDALASLAEARQVPVSVVAREALAVGIEQNGETAA